MRGQLAAHLPEAEAERPKLFVCTDITGYLLKLEKYFIYFFLGDCTLYNKTAFCGNLSSLLATISLMISSHCLHFNHIFENKKKTGIYLIGCVIFS